MSISKPVDFYTRKRINNESYANSMLTSIEAILESAGGRILVKNEGRGGEVSVGYCDGITIHTAYNADNQHVSGQFFWAKIFTPQKKWQSIPVVGILKDFFEMSTTNQVNEFRKDYNI